MSDGRSRARTGDLLLVSECRTRTSVRRSTVRPFPTCLTYSTMSNSIRKLVNHLDGRREEAQMVGVVVVSHSPEIARGRCGHGRSDGGSKRCPLHSAGGDSHGTLGTDEGAGAQRDPPRRSRRWGRWSLAGPGQRGAHRSSHILRVRQRRGEARGRAGRGGRRGSSRRGLDGPAAQRCRQRRRGGSSMLASSETVVRLAGRRGSARPSRCAVRAHRDGLRRGDHRLRGRAPMPTRSPYSRCSASAPAGERSCGCGPRAAMRRWRSMALWPASPASWIEHAWAPCHALGL